MSFLIFFILSTLDRASSGRPRTFGCVAFKKLHSGRFRNIVKCILQAKTSASARIISHGRIQELDEGSSSGRGRVFSAPRIPPPPLSSCPLTRYDAPHETRNRSPYVSRTFWAH